MPISPTCPEGNPPLNENAFGTRRLCRLFAEKAKPIPLDRKLATTLSCWLRAPLTTWYTLAWPSASSTRVQCPVVLSETVFGNEAIGGAASADKTVVARAMIHGPDFLGSGGGSGFTTALTASMTFVRVSYFPASISWTIGGSASAASL